MRHRVVLVQPYLAEYRVPLFGKLAELLRGDGIDFRVLVGRRTNGPPTRRDSNSGWAGLVTVPSISLRVWGHEARYRRLGPQGSTASLIIFEHASGALETYLWGLTGRPPIALWGHGRAFVTEQNPLDSALEKLQLRRASHYFAYTRQGAEAVAAAGFPPNRVTVFNNSTDTVGLKRLLTGVTQSDIADTRAQLRLRDERIILVLGSIDESKRVDVALAVHRRVVSTHRDSALVFAGAGSRVPEVLSAESAGYPVRWAGRKTGPELAALGATSELILNPGRVGLVATDSFALGLPIVATRWSRHAPEFSYLVDGINALVLDDSIDGLVGGVNRLLSSDALMERLRDGCRASLGMYSAERSAEAIRAGIHTALRT